tara:strand:+ start:2631 stop:5135 length:2505 start_codon:yes stop_codon:yes gene_type:complete
MVNNKFILDSLSSDEGTTVHKDERDILTGPYGVVIQPNTDAYAANQAIAKSLGIETLNKDTSVEDFARIATKKFELDGIKLTEVYPEYNSLKPEFQYVLQDTHFNTGSKYPTLAKRLLEFQNNPTDANKKRVIKESRRTIDGKPSRGLDNRTAKVLARAGIIVSTDEATTNRLKLATVDLSDVNKYADYKEIEPVVDSEPDADTDVVEPGTTDMLEDVAQQELQEAVDAADRDEQLQQAESLKVQTEKAVPTLPTPKPDVKPTPEPEPEQPSLFEGVIQGMQKLFKGDDEPTQEALDAKKNVLDKLNKIKNRPVVSGVPTMNKGGVSIKEQMSMFDDGGLLDEGGTTDPVSGNDVPPGSMQEEVRDDIPAQLSEGEFVFPADVVRYIGLEKLMQLRQEAKMGLKRMEEMGQMGNSDEATMPDDLPFTLDDLELDDEPMQMQVGGFVDPNIQMQQSQFGQMAPVQPPAYIPPPPPAPFVPAQQAATPVMAAPEVLPTFEQLMPAPEGRYDELVEFENKDTGQKMTIPFVNGEPIYPIPQGFTRVETDIVEPTPEPEVVPTAQVESAVDDGDDDQRAAEDEAMYGPGGGRVSLGGELYTGPTRFVGDGVRSRQLSGTVQGATKVGVSFDVPDGFGGLKSAVGLGAGLAFGKGIPENATATFFLNGQTKTVTAEEYNKIKENKFRGVEAENVLQELQQRGEYNQAQKDERVSRSKRNREKLDKRLEAAQKTGKENAVRKAELDVLKNEAAKFGLDTKNFNIDNMQELKDKISEETYRQAEINRQRKASQNTYHQYESDKGESRNEYSFSDYSDNVAAGTEDRGYGAAYDEDVLGLAD